MTLIKYFWLLGAAVLASLSFSSCSEEPEEPAKERLILIYAVAANSLEADLSNDMREILEAAPELNLKNNAILVYSVDYSNECKLQKLVYNKHAGKFEFSIETIFPELPLSTSGERINDVLTYVSQTYDYERKGLILWSHATGWIPWDKGSTPGEDKMKSFGDDRYQGGTYKTNINDLAAAIPANEFDFIWFDCCYMANIETFYQLRDKTSYLVGYVEEIAAAGMPYDLTIPRLLNKDSDLEGAATVMADYYAKSGYTAPISIIHAYDLNRLALTAKEIFALGEAPSSMSYIQNYTRSQTMGSIKFYDLGQLLESYTGVGENIIQEFKNALEEAVVYKTSNGYSWPGPVINPAHYSGLSVHNFVDNNTYEENFYKELDWYKATR